MRILFLGIFSFLVSFHLFAQSNEEFRSTWIVDHHWLSPGSSVEQNKALTRQVLDNHLKANMTSVLWQVRRFGSVYYPSGIEPWGVQANFQNPGYDPLAYAIEQAHARGLEFHAWFNTFESRFAYSGSPSQVHPEWICRDQDGNAMPTEIAWLSPGLPDVRQYLLGVVMEIVNNYDIDGLHLDFVRWNEHTNSGKSLALAQDNIRNQLPDGYISEAQFKELTTNASGRYLYDVNHPFSAGVPVGFGTWEEWWRATVTDFVSNLQDSIKAVKPWVRLSPAALGRYNWGGWQGFSVVYQDAALWLNEGYIDQLIGMHYHWNKAADIFNVLQGGCPNCWSDFIQPAIQAGRLYTVGLFSDNFAANNLFGRHPSIIDTVRSVDWADGFQFFSYASWRDQNYWETAREQFFNRKTKIRAPGLIDNTPPDAPTIILSKIDSLSYQVTVTPAATTSEKNWFAIYRSEDAVPDVSNDEIINIAFGDTQFSHTDSFTGLQDFNDNYTYFATQLDRFWNESTTSNSALSDPIPSFAPIVSASFPAEGDTISVNKNIDIAFSKTMDINSFQNSVSFSPSVTIRQLTWAKDHKSVIVEIDGNLIFGTNYTLTIAGSVTDINGRALDGNGDGITGDDFQLSFVTLSEDNTGPQVILGFPDLNSTEDSFTIDEIITFVFDELIDATSVTTGNIIFDQNNVPVPFDFIVTDMDEFSVLSIQPDEPLQPNTEYRVVLSQAITDTLGNAMSADVAINFGTANFNYSDVTMIDNFTFPGDWWQPNASGTTVGIVVSGTAINFQNSTVLPVPRPKKAAQLKYQWDLNAASHLLREYLSGGAPRNVQFDSTYVMQCYVFGDGSNNQIRFAVDDHVPTPAAENHEVSKWFTIDWVGWRLVEWQMSDPNSVGNWLGDGVLDGTLRFDSFQMTFDATNGAESGKIYFDDLRIVKKTVVPVGIGDEGRQIPTAFSLYQNYPNPFNPSTVIAFDLPESGFTKLKVYDMLGREVAILVNGQKNSGHYEIHFDAENLASGLYLYRLSLKNRVLTRRMLLLK